MQRYIKDYLSLFLWITFFLIIGSLIGTSTQSQIQDWYILLNRSPLTPPNYAFSIAWSILYIMIATSGWMIWRSHFFPQLSFMKSLFIIQLLLNWSWTPIFFHYHLLGWSLICISTILILVGLLIALGMRTMIKVSLILTPYWLWLAFASYLNFYIWLNN